MSDLVGNPEDRFSQNEAHIQPKCAEHHVDTKGRQPGSDKEKISDLLYCTADRAIFSAFKIASKMLDEISTQ